MNIEGKSVLVTGANRGIGAALVRAFLKHGVGKVYAAARDPSSLPNFEDIRVTPVQIDVTKSAEVNAAANKMGAIDILVNNAGIMTFANILSASSDELAMDMDVNYYGTLRVMQAFTPLIEKQGGGAIVNIVSIVGLAPPPAISGYSASKAALFSATQAARSTLKPKKIEVFGVFPGPIDTDLAKNLPFDKASPVETAENIVKGIIGGQEDIYPDPTSNQLSSLWNSNPKGLEQFFANSGA
jgi:NAD(P)-dependent dehydrogenase (short-subunit alcohol dehydrogenase family)